MDKIEVLTLVIGAFGVIITLYLREAIKLINERKSLIIQLESYLLDWLDNFDDVDLTSIMNVGYILKDKKFNLYLNKGNDGLKEFEEEKNKFIQKMITELICSEEYLTNLKNNQKRMKIDEKLYSHTIENLDYYRDSLYNDKLFISDSNASKISWLTATRTIKIKRIISSLIEESKELFILVSVIEDLEKSEELKETYTKLLKNLIYFSIEYAHLTEELKYIKDKSTCQLLIMDIKEFFKSK